MTVKKLRAVEAAMELAGCKTKRLADELVQIQLPFKVSVMLEAQADRLEMKPMFGIWSRTASTWAALALGFLIPIISFLEAGSFWTDWV